MKRLLLLLVSVFALTVASPAMADTKTVQITKSGFVPTTVTVTQGDTVTWKNVDATSHQVVADDGTFASVALKTNDTYSYTFAKAGTFKYHDTFSKARGTVTVAAPPTPQVQSITLSPSRTSVVYGGSVDLTGQVSPALVGQPVTLSADEAGGDKTIKTVDTTTTTTGGQFTFSVNPSIQTTYRVESGPSQSHDVTVYVAPRVTLVVNSHGIFTARALSDQSYAGHTVLFQRLNRSGSWRTVKVVVLRGNGAALFSAALPRGKSYVRVWMNAGQAGFGYIAGHSATLLVRR